MQIIRHPAYQAQIKFTFMFIYINMSFFKYIEDCMPAKSEKQRKMMAIAEHQPKKLYKRNKNVLNMSKEELHDFSVKVKKTKKKWGHAKNIGK